MNINFILFFYINFLFLFSKLHIQNTIYFITIDRKKNKNNNFQIIYAYFLLYILVKFKYRYQTVGQTVEVLMRLTYDGRKV